MKLYYVVGSPNCRKVHAAINHLGIDVEFEYMDFFEGDLKKPGYLAINPCGMVPSLRDGDFVLAESNAIMQYLADKVPGNTLFPRDERTRADIVRWQCWELAHYNKALGQLAWETVAKPNFMGAQPDAGVVHWAQQELSRHAPVLDAHLEGRKHAVGDKLTLADYSLSHLEMFKEAIPFDWSPFPNLNKYYERMRSVAHWAKTAPASPQQTGRRPKTAQATR
ncbi:MAG: glutathione S-transferase family protein [Burkholderiaceae bacterium]